MLTRAYATFDIKSVDEDQRILEGLASTPSVDRVGDIMNPEGAKYALPMPLLWQHQHDQPIGHVLAVTPGKKGIKIRAQIAKGVLPRIDEAWALIKAGLVRGLSIGFKPLEDEGIPGSMGRHYKTWDWLELSAVTIPANQDATILAVKSADVTSVSAASGHHLPGDTGARVVRLRDGTMSMAKNTTREQIGAFEAKRAATDARLTEIMSKSAEEGRTLDDVEKAEYDTATTELSQIDEHLVRLKDLEKRQIASALPVHATDPVSGAAARVPVLSVRSNLPPGIGMARYAMCAVLAYKFHRPVEQVAKEKYPDYADLHDHIQKATVPGGTTTDPTWAGALVYPTQLASEFVEYLRPRTIVGQFGQGSIPSLRRVPFNVRMVGQTSGGAGYWVGQGAGKPLTKFDYAAQTLLYTKVAAISVITEELARFSSPSAEMLVRDGLTSAIVARIDTDFVDPAHAAVVNVSPASITNGVTPIASSGNTADNVRQDLAALINAFVAANVDPTSLVLIMPNSMALTLSLMTNPLGQSEFPNLTMRGGSLQGIPVIASQYVALGGATGNIVIAANASDIYLADDGGVTIDASREATLQMDDLPTMTGGAIPSPAVGVSMFQTNSIALRAERFINWAKRRPTAVVFMNNVEWGAPVTP